MRSTGERPFVAGIPRKGESQRPASGVTEKSSRSAFNCFAAESAITTPRLRKLSRVWLYTQYLRDSVISPLQNMPAGISVELNPDITAGTQTVPASVSAERTPGDRSEHSIARRGRTLP